MSAAPLLSRTRGEALRDPKQPDTRRSSRGRPSRMWIRISQGRDRPPPRRLRPRRCASLLRPRSLGGGGGSTGLRRAFAGGLQTPRAEERSCRARRSVARRRPGLAGKGLGAAGRDGHPRQLPPSGRGADAPTDGGAGRRDVESGRDRRRQTRRASALDRPSEGLVAVVLAPAPLREVEASGRRKVCLQEAAL